MRRLRIFTWHIHGSYLYYLSQLDHDIFIPITPDRSLGYYGRTPSYPWSPNVKEIPAAAIKDTRFDCVIYQHKRNWTIDREEVLSPEQRNGPQIYIEHDPPRETPTDTRHIVDDPNVLLVHVTSFNELMWNNNQTPTHVIEHGVLVPPHIRYTGDLSRACVVINNLRTRGRRLGLDIYQEAKGIFPIDLVGMGWDQVDGIGERSHTELFSFMKEYRFFFNPIRYTSLGLAVCEAMMIGLPILGLATTEMVTAIRNGVNGYVETDRFALYRHMSRLLGDPDEALFLSRGARKLAHERFNIERFKRNWDKTLHDVVGHRTFSLSPAYISSKESHANLND